ncbi:hypothetical protein BD410DRAFT_796823 [Rickenella mellea]|uniref:Uncharacterized protein n=1 Tax=Rickenella mellea TaxID=50990 RepID=A0A4Y7PIZ7_9AGAM|nr:hypothetical protein BD410DRAFT_796823 [Rickenella mellea]
MTTRPPPIEPVAPYTGKIRYPLDGLLDLARSIIHDLERHHRSLLEAAREADNEDGEAEEIDNLTDIDQSMFALDRLRWKARVEADSPGYEWSASDVEGFNDPSAGEEGLLTLGHTPKAAWVIGRAIERRKEKRGAPPLTDASWNKEDALLDFLLFLAKYNHVGLFSSATSSET